MDFKWTITAGELLQIISILLAVFSVYNRISVKLMQIETKLEPIYEWWQRSVSIGRDVTAREYVDKHRGKSGD